MTVKVKMTGPILEGRGPARLRPVVVRLNKRLADIGEEFIAQKARIRPAGEFKTRAQAGKKVSKGNYRRRIRKELKGLVFKLTNSAIYGPWIEGTSSRNKTSRFKGYHIYRQAKQFIQSQIPKEARRTVDDIKKELRG
jgi:hypothetical protein